MPQNTQNSRPERSRARKARAKTDNAFSALLPSLKAEVERRLFDYLSGKLKAAEAHGSDVVDIVSAVRDLCARGGKRLRPALLVAGHLTADAHADLAPAFDAGVALELLQAYFLIHDDWMDQDTVRRGGPTAHTALAQRYRSVHKGNSAAILAGDFAVGLATEALAQVPIKPSRVKRVFASFAEMQLDAVAGQQLDQLARAPNVEAAYVLKTGSYTVRGPLRLGALLAGGSDSLLSALDRFALPAGVAFQLRDDLIGVFGQTADTGKPRGADLKAGKRTVLVTFGQQLSTPSERAVLSKVLGQERATSNQVERAIRVLETSGAKAKVEARIEELCAEARSALSARAITEHGRQLLLGALDALASRRN